MVNHCTILIALLFVQVLDFQWENEPNNTRRVRSISDCRYPIALKVTKFLKIYLVIWWLG